MFSFPKIKVASVITKKKNVSGFNCNVGEHDDNRRS